MPDSIPPPKTNTTAPPKKPHPNEPEDWTWSELHKRIITPTGKADRLTAYAKWAPMYELDAEDMQYMAPSTSVDRLWAFIEPRVLEAAGNGTALRILDAGCGTGLCAEKFRTKGASVQAGLHLIGLDYSEEMMDVAAKKGLYEELVQADLNEKLVQDGGKVDCIVCVGVFVEGHCGPEILPNLLGVLKEGGYATVSVRNKTFIANKAAYLGFIEKSDCVVVENKVFKYIEKGEHYANYLIIRKRAAMNGNRT